MALQILVGEYRRKSGPLEEFRNTWSLTVTVLDGQPAPREQVIGRQPDNFPDRVQSIFATEQCHRRLMPQFEIMDQ
jgi:hypothetical protein